MLLAGDGPHRAHLERRARELGIAERVHFLGPIANADLPRYHAISDLFVVPSTDHETFCIAACEAMACARPVVAARTGGLPEVVRDGETGYLAPPGDAQAMAERIGALLGDAALRERMGAAGAAGRWRCSPGIGWSSVCWPAMSRRWRDGRPPTTDHRPPTADHATALIRAARATPPAMPHRHVGAILVIARAEGIDSIATQHIASPPSRANGFDDGDASDAFAAPGIAAIVGEHEVRPYGFDDGDAIRASA